MSRPLTKQPDSGRTPIIDQRFLWSAQALLAPKSRSPASALQILPVVVVGKIIAIQSSLWPPTTIPHAGCRRGDPAGRLYECSICGAHILWHGSAVKPCRHYQSNSAGAMNCAPTTTTRGGTAGRPCIGHVYPATLFNSRFSSRVK